MTHLVGTARARELMYTADKVDAERCEQIGLFNRVVPDAVLRDEAFKLASSIAAGPSIALRNMKDNLNDALSNDYMTSLDGEAPRLVETSRTNDHKEAVRAFIEKRDPVFTGT
jgi:enoyl-CoA hydratase/carnithine racemase